VESIVPRFSPEQWIFGSNPPSIGTADTHLFSPFLLYK
jgi:hypothetical protein